MKKRWRKNIPTLVGGRIFVIHRIISLVFEKAKAEVKASKEIVKASEEKISATENELKIAKHIAKMLMNQCSEAEINKSLQEKFALTEDQAKEEYKKVIE